jgi:hypothetical protein
MRHFVRRRRLRRRAVNRGQSVHCPSSGAFQAHSGRIAQEPFFFSPAMGALSISFFALIRA